MPPRCADPTEVDTTRSSSLCPRTEPLRAQPTGIQVLDELLGGIRPGLPCVVSGPSGAGRTVLALATIGAALDAGRVVTLLCNEPAPFLLAQADSLGVDLRAPLERGQLALLEMDVDVASAVTGLGTDALVRAVSDQQPLTSLLVIDPFTVLTSGLYDESQLRASARDFVRAAQDWQVLLTVEQERLALQQGLERILLEICGSFVTLERDDDGNRSMRLEKTRSGVASRSRLPFEIGAAGLSGCSEAEPAVPDPPAAAPVGAVEAQQPPEPAPEPTGLESGPPALRQPLAEPLLTAEPGGAAPPSQDRDRPRRVLLVDPDPETLATWAKWLEGRYEVQTARDGFEAMTSLLTGHPDLVVLELLMPRVTGYELLAATQRAGMRVPRLVVSERIQRPGDRLAPLMLGATDVVPKPVERFELRHKVDTLLRLQGSGEPLLEAPDAEALFASISKSRLLERELFEDRIRRVERLGERLGMASSITAISADSTAAMDLFLETSDPELRFEDAFLRVSPRRAVLLLVATDREDALPVMERLLSRYEEGGGRAGKLRCRSHAIRPLEPDFDWASLFRTGRRGSDAARAEEPDDAPSPGEPESGS